MEPRFVTVSSEGEIPIPKELLDQFDVKSGDELVVAGVGKTLVIQKLEVDWSEKDLVEDLSRASESVMKRVWGTKADDVWDTV